MEGAVDDGADGAVGADGAGGAGGTDSGEDGGGGDTIVGGVGIVGQSTVTDA